MVSNILSVHFLKKFIIQKATRFDWVLWIFILVIPDIPIFERVDFTTFVSGGIKSSDEVAH